MIPMWSEITAMCKAVHTTFHAVIGQVGNLDETHKHCVLKPRRAPFIISKAVISNASFHIEC